MSSAKTTAKGLSPTVNLGWALASLLRDYQKQVEAALDGLPGGARSFLVMSIVEEETCQSQIAIADRLSLDKTTLTYLLDGLETAKLIKRVTDPNDRRSRHINLTDEGAKALGRYATAVKQVEHSILARLGAEEAAQFQTSLFRVAGLLGDEPGRDADGQHTAEICKASLGASENC